MFASLASLQDKLSAGPGQILDWFPEGVSVSQLAETLTGMANNQGGQVLLGIARRSGAVSGIQELEKTLDRVFQTVIQVEPVLVLPIPRQYRIEGRDILVVDIPSGLPNVYTINGRYLVRAGRQTRTMTPSELRRLLMERGQIRFESQVVPGAGRLDLDWDLVAAYAEHLDYPAEVPLETLLLRRGCLAPGNGFTAKGDIQPTNAAILLFGKYPQQWLPGATILAARFSGQGYAERFVTQDVRGTLPNQIRLAEAFLADQMISEIQLDGLTHTRKTEYPQAAVRELLVNAVTHRDYNLQGDCVHLNLFADHLEIQSPGGLPGPITLDNMLETRFARNAIITQVLSDMGFVERLGFGLKRVIAAVRAHNLPQPEFRNSSAAFRVVIYGQSKYSSPAAARVSAYPALHPRQQAALDYLSSNQRITNREYQELCPEVHPETLRRDLADLVQRGIIVKIGAKRSTYYILK